MRLAFATCATLPNGSPDDRPAAAMLGAQFQVWDDPDVDWASFDRVIIRSTWDYVFKRERFLQWAHAVGPQRLRNSPDLVEFNSDKRYLRELTSPTIPTQYVDPGDPMPDFEDRDDEIVIKPSVSAGGRDTGRFSARTFDLARDLVREITGSGRTAMIQPFLSGVDNRGEISLVYLAGRLSHVLHKKPVLRPDEVAPVAPHEPFGPAAILDEEGFVSSGHAEPAHHRIGQRVLREIGTRFAMPLFLRVDLVPGPAGSPVVIELEAIEPSLYLSTSPGASERFAAAVLGS